MLHQFTIALLRCLQGVLGLAPRTFRDRGGLGASQERSNHFTQDLGVQRLAEVGLRPSTQAPDPVFVLAQRPRDMQYGNVARRGHRFEARTDFEPVEVWKVHIQQNQRRSRARRGGQRFCARASLEDVESYIAQHGGSVPQSLLAVIDIEDQGVARRCGSGLVWNRLHSPVRHGTLLRWPERDPKDPAPQRVHKHDNRLQIYAPTVVEDDVAGGARAQKAEVMPSAASVMSRLPQNVVTNS